MAKPIALQIYSVREEMNKDFEQTIQKIAGMGYAAVEVAALPETVSPEHAKAVFDDLGLEIIAAHSGLPGSEPNDPVLKAMQALGHRNLVCPWLDPTDYFSSVEGVKKACALLNEANNIVQDAGARLHYHNHWFEFQLIDGTLPFDVMLNELDESIGFELDTYWVTVAGQDPIKVLQQLGARVPLLHVKDGPATAIEPAMTAVGKGTLNYPEIIAAADSEWLIVELDRCDTDMLEAVEDSINYLVDQKIGQRR